ncbi:hypothetical protein PybrP1_010055, partial [[Pythium] brassicae (nom. inval.)]
DASAFVGEIVHASPLDGAATSDAASSIPLLSSEDVARFWTERRDAFVAKRGWESRADGVGDAAGLDLELKFLPSESLQELLAGRSGDGSSAAESRSFVAINTICFFADELPCVAVIDANCKLDTAQIALFAGVGRRRIKLATSLECQQVFGFSPGTVPPFGHRVIETVEGDGVVGHEGTEQTTCEVRPAIFVDRSLEQFEYLVGGGASFTALLSVSSKAFFSVIAIEAVGDIQRSTGPPSLSSSFATLSLANAAASRQSALSSADASGSVAAHDADTGGNAVDIEMKFLADAMVARVGKWMRTIGIDVVIWDSSGPMLKTNGSGRDPKAGLLGLAAREQRVVLTRDKKLADRRDAGACFVVSSDDPFQQFQEIKAHFALQLRKDEMMSRCAVCNAKSFKRVDAAYARAQTAFEVPARVLEIVDEFWVCTLCDKIFWEGPKFSSAYDNVMRMFDGAYEPEAALGWHRERATHSMMPPQNDDATAAGESAAPDASVTCSAAKSPAPAMFRYTPPPYFDARSRVPRFLQRALADAFMFVVYHYNLWALPALGFFYALYQSGHGLIALALVAIYIPRLLDGSERTANGRPWPWLWLSPVWRFCSEFLGVTVTREQELDPAKRYIFGFHPHGILILSRIATYGGTWEAVFPGISVRLLGASAVFHVPLAREICLWLNAVDASRSTAEKVLKSGRSVMVYPGGIPEIFLTEPESKENKVLLKNRLGFVKLAIRHGAELVPVFTFGEKWLFNVWTPPKRAISFFRKVLKIPIIVFWGRFLWMPRRLPAGKRFGIVYGKPIPTAQIDEPTDAEVQKVHALYVAEIERLFAQYKGEFGYDADETLVVM